MPPERKPRRLSRLAAALVLTATPSVVSATPAAATETDVTFTSDGNTLHATVLTPPGNPTGRPGVVFLAGAGSTSRWDHRAEAEAFAKAGIVSLVYDKRAGYSRATSTFSDLANDALSGVRLLRGRPEVAPSAVGLWGHSQGGWVAPLAASRSDEVSFVVAVGASGLNTARTQLWSNHTYLKHAGVAPELVGPIGHNLSRMLIAADMFGDTGHDPAATLAKVRQPLLGVFGEHDRSTAPGESLPLFRQALDQGGNKHYTLRVVPDANHNLRRSTDGFTRGSADFAPGYIDVMTSWINDRTDGSPPASADPPPAQDLPSEPVAALAWYESPALHLIAFGLMLVAFLAYPVSAAWHRLRGRRTTPSVRWPVRLLTAVGPIAALGTLAYLFFIVATGATAVTSTVLGRPPIWLALQLAALGVVAAAVATAVRWRRAQLIGRDRRRLGLALAGGVIFLPLAAYWGLYTV
ncbi:alpha/beta hydrolase family protein [Kibdelosporangium phytohabitans]|uniref:Peptidase S9 prolyl oligopeptidase catalytic domain-containing protein n=1 Tax=Kibdelosporangium phytohabitans TaxID=860235 RepID=A0A0N7F3G4_9PSEU|nr:prolyl oligopeptidase family serine peptidase [Kibdelosporangium phytohabitans]ALG08559.1 hypothetical protein AOZ06_18010 [Kibdelosporangium phytohabitans]MBE1470362.1 dienelactone hydrolase [Kibdelosporangium phytohabitans]